MTKFQATSARIDESFSRLKAFGARRFSTSPIPHCIPAQKFLINDDILRDVGRSSEAYVNTFLDMLDMGIAEPPFDVFAIWCKSEGAPIEPVIGYYPDGIQSWVRERGRFISFPMDRDGAETAFFFYMCLVVLLATPNVIKDRQGVKKLRLGQTLGDAPSTTILRIGKVEYEDTGISVPGVEPRDIRPHLRRGHIRQQAHGEGRLLRKKIFVPPCFVNGDPSFLPKRDHYEVRMATNV